jgi:two-component system sensor histidine kinase DegS
MGISYPGRYHRQIPRLRRPHLWIIIILFVALTLSHYTELLSEVPILCHISLPAGLGLARHSLERLLYLLLVLYSGWALGIILGGALWLSSGVAMLLRSFLISPHFRDAVLESSATIVIGALAIILMEMWRRSNQREERLKEAMDDLRLSQQNYEELFTNTSDAIWVQDMEGNVTLANKACEKLTGYPVPELIGKNVSQFLAPEALALARQIKPRLLKGEAMEQRYEQRLNRKDGSEAIINLATRLIASEGKPQAFQNIARDITEERKLQDNLRFYLRECLRVQEEERKRLASDLHDDTSQLVLLLSHRIDNLASEASNYLPREIRNEFEKLYELSQQAYEGIKRYAQALRPRILDDLGLVPALEWLAQEITKLAGIKVQVKTNTVPPLPPETQLVLFRIAQEALNNIYRHSEASEANITLEHQEDEVRMTISDNGKGFGLPQRLSDFAGQGKLGLTGMAERAQLAGGEFEVTSQIGGGTKIVVKAPTKLYDESNR